MIAKDWQLIRVWTMTKLSKSQEQTTEQELSAELRLDASQTKQVMYLSCTSSVSFHYVAFLYSLIHVSLCVQSLSCGHTSGLGFMIPDRPGIPTSRYCLRSWMMFHRWRRKRQRRSPVPRHSLQNPNPGSWGPRRRMPRNAKNLWMRVSCFLSAVRYPKSR